MKFDKEKLQEAINDISTIRNVSFYQSNIYNSLRLAEDVLKEILSNMKEKADTLEFDIKVSSESKNEEVFFCEECGEEMGECEICNKKVLIEEEGYCRDRQNPGHNHMKCYKEKEPFGHSDTTSGTSNGDEKQ